MSGLVACPFCRQIFQKDEAKLCPECGLSLSDLHKLGPSHDALLEEPEEALPPHMEELPWTYLGRGRGWLLLLSLLGLAAFFAPWVHERSPELRVMSGFDLARRLGWLWAPAVAFFVMFPLALTRRSVFKMRGARFSIAFLSVLVLLTVIIRAVALPVSPKLAPLRFSWGFGIYATFVVALLTLAVSLRFGGRLDDLPTKRKRDGTEVLH